MVIRFFVFVFMFCSYAHVASAAVASSVPDTLSTGDVDRIKADYQRRCSDRTFLEYAEKLVEEASEMLKGTMTNQSQKDIHQRFRDAKQIIMGRIWGVSDKAATDQEKKQYFHTIGKIGIFEKIAGGLSSLSPSRDAHQNVINSLFDLTYADESILYSSSSLQEACKKYQGVDKTILEGHIAKLRELIPFKDDCFDKIFVANLHRKFLGDYEAFYKKPKPEDRAILPEFGTYLSDHDFIVGRDPVTGIVYVSWNIATQAKKTDTFTNNGFALNENTTQYKARLGRIVNVLAEISNYFGPKNVVFCLQEVTEGTDGYDVFLTNSLNRTMKTAFTPIKKKTEGTSFNQAIIYDKDAFSISVLDPSKGPQAPYMDEVTKRILCSLISRVGGSNLSTLLCNLHLDWSNVNKNSGAKNPYDFSKLINYLNGLAYGAWSCAIMGDTNYDNLASSGLVGPNVRIPTDSSVAANIPGYNSGRLKAIDMMMFLDPEKNDQETANSGASAHSASASSSSSAYTFNSGASANSASVSSSSAAKTVNWGMSRGRQLVDLEDFLTNRIKISLKDKVRDLYKGGQLTIDQLHAFADKDFKVQNEATLDEIRGVRR